jgi:hypothetical protein
MTIGRDTIIAVHPREDDAQIGARATRPAPQHRVFHGKRFSVPRLQKGQPAGRWTGLIRRG